MTKVLSLAAIGTSKNALARWAEPRCTDLVIAHAIHAIAIPDRHPAAIWECPVDGELSLVVDIVAELLNAGDYDRSADDRYHWGVESFTIKAETLH